jgi:hypothetical protein
MIEISEQERQRFVRGELASMGRDMAGGHEHSFGCNRRRFALPILFSSRLKALRPRLLVMSLRRRQLRRWRPRLAISIGFACFKFRLALTAPRL